ncbi:helix-turn-helix transcriptional regulator [Peterkaempfera bronchialis]|uniref:helix-turn-helix transcriptional regulator n=1 Tax=Peterkaempfera bronchialis TaxID=2126346 RepID=UPI003C2D5AED
MEHLSVSPVFVGRSRESAVLAEALGRADTGLPQALLIGGEAGVGKTRLLEEFLTSACAAGAVTATGGCLEVGAEGLPYAPLVTALRRLHRALGSELEQAADGHESRLARLLPDFGEAAPEANDEYGRARLFEHTARLFERLAADRTLVLAVEDLHWSDRSTRELLAYLIRTLHRARVVVVATYRTDDLHRRHPVRPFLAELERMRTVQRLELPRLARAEVEQQLAGILGTAAPDRELVSRIYRRSEGNPFFVEELACCATEGCDVGLSESLRDILLVRVEALPERAQTVVRVAAEGGSSVEYGLLAAVLALPEDDLIEALRAAVGANILVPDPEGEGYRFRHALVREAVVDDLLPGERSRINRRYADALEADPALVRCDVRAARLASYWYHAHDPARALPAVLHAGREARRRNAFAEQLRMLERALELWDDVPDQVLLGLRAYDYADESYPPCSCDPGTCDDDCERLRFADVLAEATVAARRAGDRDRGLRFIKMALRQVDERTDPHRAAWFWLQRGRAVRYYNGTFGRPELEHARALVEGGRATAVQADVLSRIAADGMLTCPTRTHIEVAEGAAAIAREVGARTVELHALLTLGTLRCDFGETEAGLAGLREVCAGAAELDDPDLHCRAVNNLASLLEQLGRSEEAVQVAREGLELSRRYGMIRYNGAMMTGNLAEPLISLGHHEEAARLLAETDDPPADTVNDDFLERLRGELALLRDDPAEAGRHLVGARNRANTAQPQKLLPAADLALRLAARTGRFADARAELLAAAGDGFPVGFEQYAWPLLVHGVAAEADSRGLPAADPGRAEVLAQVRAAAAPLSRAVPLYQGWALLLDAELARAEGRDTPDSWLPALEVLRSVGRPYPLASALLRAAEAHAAAGAREEAGALLREAEAVGRIRDDVRLLREVALFAERARLAVDGGATRPAAAAARTAEDPVAALGLTARERDVLRLLALGRTNRQIAEELYISPKTASVHVSNILAKLGVGGRGEAAAVAHRMRLFPGDGVAVVGGV